MMFSDLWPGVENVLLAQSPSWADLELQYLKVRLTKKKKKKKEKNNNKVGYSRVLVQCVRSMEKFFPSSDIMSALSALVTSLDGKNLFSME